MVAKVVNIHGEPIKEDTSLEGTLEAQEREVEKHIELLKGMGLDIGPILGSYITRLKQLAVTDGLTGLYKAEYLKERLEREVRVAERSGRDLSLIFIDIDYFKRVNDTYGHQVGDKVLKTVAETMKKCINRGSDILARWGGEEFAIILPETNREGAKRLAEEIRREVEAKDFEYEEGKSIKVTISLGIGEYLIGNGVHFFTKRTDEALYIAKQLDRNQCVVSLE